MNDIRNLWFTVLFLCVSIHLQAEDLLASWNNGINKQKIIEFVKNVSDNQHASFVPKKDRIAVIDQDGTIWCEKPRYTQIAYILKRMNHHFSGDASKNHRSIQFLDSINSSDHSSVKEFMELGLVAHSNQTFKELNDSVWYFVSKELHPRFAIPYSQTVYRPMVELIDFLHNHDFKVFIVSGSGIEFIRAFSQEFFNIPPDRVIGSALQTWYVKDPHPHLVLVPFVVLPLNNGAGKPINIQRTIGQVPILAIGNSDGDIEMLQYVEQPGRPSLSIMIHHDDEEREYAYDKGAKKLLKEVDLHEFWLKVSMRNDFKTIF